MKKLLLVLLAFVAACTPGSNIGADGYRFKTKQFEKHVVVITVITYGTPGEVSAAAAAALNKSTISTDHQVNPNNVVAFSEITPANQLGCTIHMVDPAITYQPEFVGHEFLHCVYGQWHGDNLTNN